jgi:hypothetical protein
MKSFSKFIIDNREMSLDEKTGDKAAYQAFFRKTLKKYGVDEPDKLAPADKKKFYDEIDAGWEGDNEKPEPGDKKEDCGSDHKKKKKGLDETTDVDCPECSWSGPMPKDGVCPKCGYDMS